MTQLSDAKQRELETRKRLGPRLGRSRKAGHPVTLDPRTPRATGAAGSAIRRDWTERA